MVSMIWRVNNGSPAYLNNIRPNYLPLALCFPAVGSARAIAAPAEELVLNFIIAHYWAHVEPPYVAREQVADLLYISILHFTQALVEQTRPIRELVQADHACERHGGRHASEANVDQFGDIQASVVVPVKEVRTYNHSQRKTGRTGSLLLVWVARLRRCIRLGRPPLNCIAVLLP